MTSKHEVKLPVGLDFSQTFFDFPGNGKFEKKLGIPGKFQNFLKNWNEPNNVNLWLFI